MKNKTDVFGFTYCCHQLFLVRDGFVGSTFASCMNFFFSCSFVVGVVRFLLFHKDIFASYFFDAHVEITKMVKRLQ